MAGHVVTIKTCCLLALNEEAQIIDDHIYESQSINMWYPNLNPNGHLWYNANIVQLTVHLMYTFLCVKTIEICIMYVQPTNLQQLCDAIMSI